MVLISFLDFIPASLSMLINWLCSWLSDRTGERLMIAVIGFGVQGLAMCLAAAFIHAPFAVLYFFYNMFNVGFIVYDTMQRSYQADIMPKSVAASGFALVNGIGAFGGFIGPTMMGSLHGMSDSYAIPLVTLGALSGVSGGILLLLKVYKEKESPLDFFKNMRRWQRNPPPPPE